MDNSTFAGVRITTPDGRYLVWDMNANTYSIDGQEVTEAEFNAAQDY